MTPDETFQIMLRAPNYCGSAPEIATKLGHDLRGHVIVNAPARERTTTVANYASWTPPP
jgi:hypothetical protein